jgi:hypothetical protein
MSAARSGKQTGVANASICARCGEPIPSEEPAVLVEGDRERLSARGHDPGRAGHSYHAVCWVARIAELRP